MLAANFRGVYNGYEGVESMMDYDFTIDISEIKHVIETSDVMVIRFPVIGKRLLVDTRYDAEDGPMVRLVAPVTSAQERFRNLKELRPRFPLPKHIVAFSWPKHVSSLESFGVWQAIIDRCGSLGFEGTAQDCQLAFQELLRAEKAEILAAIKGEGYESVWERNN